MVKRIHEVFDNSEFAELQKKKEELKDELKLKTLSWKRFIMYKSGVDKNEY